MIDNLAKAEQVMRTPCNFTWSEQRDAFATIATEYDRRASEIVELKVELDDAWLQYDQLLGDIGGVSPG